MRIWINPLNTAQLFRDPNDPRRRQRICNDLDERGFGWLVCFVAGSGFFTNSYNLFATNVILPCLAFVYWNTAVNSLKETQINLITLAGSIIGQLAFGYLADKYGRRRIYGLELIFVIFGTLGLAESSSGYNNSMDILGWLIFWRFFVGVGIGAEYPLAAVITAEFSPVQSRARMMATVFSMQSLGQLVAAAVGLTVLVTMGSRNLNSNLEHNKAVVDSMWRIVVGVGAFPALIAIIFRLLIPESPRFTLDVGGDSKQALLDTQLYLEEPINTAYDEEFETSDELSLHQTHEAEMSDTGSFQLPPAALLDDNDQVSTNSQHFSVNIDEDDQDPIPTQDVEITNDEPEYKQFSKEDLRDFFLTQGNWRYLAGTSMCWFFLDFAYYGLGINNPRTIAAIWADRSVSTTSLPQWENPWDPKASIYDVLYADYVHYIITTSIGSVLGSLLLIKIIDYVPRKSMLTWSFLSLFILFIVTGASFFRVFETDLHGLTITLYVLCQLLFNLGPNTLTFIIPAEIFPTRYRATCHGIAAASGKLGSVIVQALFLAKSIDINSDSRSLGWILIIFGFLMALGAICAWAWIPDLQWPRHAKSNDEANGLGDTEDEAKNKYSHKIPSKTLETLAKGQKYELNDEAKVGLRHKLKLLWRNVKG